MLAKKQMSWEKVENGASGVPSPTVGLLLVCSNRHGVLCSAVYTGYAFSLKRLHRFGAASVVGVAVTELTVFATTPR